MRQLHVELSLSQFEKFKLAVKRLGYVTMSAYIREKVREAIEKAEN